uniref:Maturase K n=1 Tax=Ditylenchus dipsaci TaxID=166011 RepID=A0A915E8G0_9BILA
MFPGATDDSFFERIFVHFEQNRLIRRHPRNRLQFILGHCLNTAQQLIVWKDVIQKKFNIRAVHYNARVVPFQLNHFQNAPIYPINSVFRPRNGFRRILLQHFISTGLHIECCQSVEAFAPPLCSLFPTKPATQEMTLAASNGRGVRQRDAGDVLNVSFVRQQMRSVLLIDSIRAYNRGYPERMPSVTSVDVFSAW